MIDRIPIYSAKDLREEGHLYVMHDECGGFILNNDGSVHFADDSSSFGGYTVEDCEYPHFKGCESIIGRNWIFYAWGVIGVFDENMQCLAGLKCPMELHRAIFEIPFCDSKNMREMRGRLLNGITEGDERDNNSRCKVSS